MLSQEALVEINSEVAKYPDGQERAALLAALRIAQNECGWISVDTMTYIAGILSVEPAKVAEVATFYTMYDLKPIGRYKISLCTNISCALRGSATVANHLQERLGIGFDETTEDGRITLKEVECLAACGGAPAALIGTDYYENLTPQRIDEILETLD